MITLGIEAQEKLPKHLIDFAKEKLSRKKNARIMDIWETDSQIFIKYINGGLQTGVYFK